MFHWRRRPKEKRGILCGVNEAQEWLLPWWWERYRACNDLPMTFVDFGMSASSKAWCAARGECLSLMLEEDFVASKNEIDPQLRKNWDAVSGWDVWKGRRAWFYKPFALLHSPYEEGLWIDLDCEILRSLSPIFGRCDLHSQIAICRDYSTNHLLRFDANVRYNSGVIAFLHGSSLVSEWAEAAFFQNQRFLADDNVLSYVIDRDRIYVEELEEEYNWRPAQGIHLGATIVHWVGNMGKTYIKRHGGLKPYFLQFFGPDRIEPIARDL